MIGTEMDMSMNTYYSCILCIKSRYVPCYTIICSVAYPYVNAYGAQNVEQRQQHMLYSLPLLTTYLAILNYTLHISVSS